MPKWTSFLRKFVPRVSQAGILFGLIMSLPLVAVAALEAALAWRVMESENQGFVQQSIGDTTSLLAAHYKVEISRLADRLRELSPKIQKAPSVASTGSSVEEPVSSNGVDRSEAFDPVFGDVSIWGREFGRTVELMRYTNSARTGEITSEILSSLRSLKSREAQLIEPAFRGITVMRATPGPLGEKGLALLAVPTQILAKGTESGSGVILSHLRLDSFDPILKNDSMVSSILIDEAGMPIAFGGLRNHPFLSDPKRLQSSQIFSTLSIARAQSETASGQMEFQLDPGSVKASYFGGYGAVGLAQLFVVTVVSKTEATAPIRVLQKQLLIFLGACFFLVMAGSYIVATHIDVSRVLSKQGVARGIAELQEMTRTGLNRKEGSSLSPSLPASVSKGASSETKERSEGTPPGIENVDASRVQITPPKAATGTLSLVPPPKEPSMPKRWLVNNGSQIVGPLTQKEIAGRLFAQELDFDCECWAEGTGNAAQIGTAGIFSGSEDSEATLWAFDGEIIHGPISHGFLKTAISHGALAKTISICEGSTVSGWKTYAEFTKEKSGPAPAVPPKAPKKKAA